MLRCEAVKLFKLKGGVGSSVPLDLEIADFLIEVNCCATSLSV